MYTKKTLDPHAAREAEKYSNPIPSREYILSLFKKEENGLTRQHITALLGLDSAEQKEALYKRLRAMCRDGQLVWSGRKNYTLATQSIFLKGKVISNKEGFGFILPEDGSPDIFLSAHQMRQVFPNDRVLIRIIGEPRRNRREAWIVKVLDHNTKQLIGYYQKKEDILSVIPAHPRIHHTISIPTGSQAEAQPGEVVLVEIMQQPDLRHPPIGKVIKILGSRKTTGIESLIAIHTHQLLYTWNKKVDKEISFLKKQMSLKDTIFRVDLRNLPFITIDGEDSKDFDDAVYCQLEKKQWRLYVAIADVSHYVKPGTAIDEEAKLRGNSVYLPHQVIPMLPELLSNNWCSLKPKVDRLCLVCDMKISTQGKLKSYEFYPATICSQARLTYTQVTKYLETNQYPPFHQSLREPIQHLNNLYTVLLKAREKRGAIDLNLSEAQMVLDTQGKISDIQPKARTVAHRIIEECMLMANVAAAQLLLNNNVPSLFRIHETPPPEKLIEFKNFILSLDLKPDYSLPCTPTPMDFAKLLAETSTHKDHQLIQIMLLRTMNQAVYSSKNKGHFGLAYPEYTHFTSPIRRYPDLIVHRIIYYLLAKKNQEAAIYYDDKTLENIGTNCSITERRAEEATRQVIQTLKCQLMQSHLGEHFAGKISHITGFGFFVALASNLTEGLVHISRLKEDHYLFDPKKMILRGERNGKTYRLGDSVTIRVARVNIDMNVIDFDLLEHLAP